MTPGPSWASRWIRPRAAAATRAAGPGRSCGSTDDSSPADSRRPTSWAARWAKTRPSSSEFDASRLAPCTPVQAASPAAAIRRTIACATTSRGASSARGCTCGMNRTPSVSSRSAPSPRTASETSGSWPLTPAPSHSTVGWNWTNSMSPTGAPARSAAARPSPVASDGLVDDGYTWPMPPVGDMEFVQFHPTVLWLGAGVKGQLPLVSEAVRGEGALLLDTDGVRFMPQVHPLAELAPRDVVAHEVRSEVTGIQEDVVGPGGRHLGADFVRGRSCG